MTVTDWVPYDFIPGSSSGFKLRLGTVINPDSVSAQPQMHILILAEGLYPVDEYFGFTMWEILPGTFSYAKVTSSSYIAYNQECSYTIEFTPEHEIP